MQSCDGYSKFFIHFLLSKISFHQLKIDENLFWMTILDERFSTEPENGKNPINFHLKTKVFKTDPLSNLKILQVFKKNTMKF